MLPVIEKFPKSVFAQADVERERLLRLTIHGAIGSIITEDDANYILTTTYRTSASALVDTAPAGAGLPAVQALPAAVTTGVSNPSFASLVPGGFFSSDPNDHRVPRSIRTNNPGALNISAWQRQRPGFAGVTESDGSASNNKTTIYRTPEHGVASWFHLLDVIYKLGQRPSFRVGDLAPLYAGVASGHAVDVYANGWIAASNGTIGVTTDIAMNGQPELMQLARAMFAHEAGRPSPLNDDQIDFAIEAERNGALPF